MDHLLLETDSPYFIPNDVSIAFDSLLVRFCILQHSLLLINSRRRAPRSNGFTVYRSEMEYCYGGSNCNTTASKKSSSGTAKAQQSCTTTSNRNDAFDHVISDAIDVNMEEQTTALPQFRRRM